MSPMQGLPYTIDCCYSMVKGTHVHQEASALKVGHRLLKLAEHSCLPASSLFTLWDQ